MESVTCPEGVGIALSSTTAGWTALLGPACVIIQPSIVSGISATYVFSKYHLYSSTGVETRGCMRAGGW